ncbi:hypothetical protein FDP41_007336 [Naegleria fowleri]|uniref:Response regulatory domain-containing protein n=1 Tax=Naegleria fowleri TaxID=5763 RepID=A0A6A5CFT2_NAEFO|nr:uncharacterized protein FDP41_007336 [Naegleria fowleri]KAF0984159.1 hypothetical protein FDP41_007336 [Naegleria fowleri]CAG4719323.1 unnamed protein product [Naegleria fowleri]
MPEAASASAPPSSSSSSNKEIPLGPSPASEQPQQEYAEKALLDHLLEQRKIHNKAGLSLSVLPIIFALTFCPHPKYWLFLCISAGEIAFQISLNAIVPNTLKGFVSTNILRIVGMILVQLLVYTIFGPFFPYHVLSTFKILITTKNFCFNLKLMLFAGFSLIFGACTAMIISFRIWKHNLHQEEISLFYSKLSEVFILQCGVTLGAYLFSDALSRTNREFTRQQVEITKEKVKSSEKSKFIANLSHEARNPLQCIMGSLQVLHHQFEGEQCLQSCKHCFLKNASISETLEDIKENATLLLHIFSSSLQMSSLEIGSIIINSEPFSIVSLVDSLVSVFSHLAHEKKIVLHAFCNVSQLPSIVKGDSIRISQILMNLISNAIKYTKQGFVRVNCCAATDQDLKDWDNERISQSTDHSSGTIFVKLECIDTGCGISQDQLHSLFQPFHIIENHEDVRLGFEQYFMQSGNINKLGDGGSSLIYTNRNGLGLSIAKLLINKMNGHISVKSVVNKGTTMTIILPLERVNEVDEHTLTIPNNQDAEMKSAKTVWIIDKDEYFRDVLKCYLKLFNQFSEILEFDSIQNLSSLLKSSSPDFLFLEETEFEHVRNKFPTLNFVLTCERGARRHYLEHRYLAKPVRFNELRETLLTLPNGGCVSSGKNKDEANQDEHSNKELSHKSDMSFDEYSVLLADDNEINRKVLDRMMKIIGFKDIDLAKDGMECFEKYKQKSYDLILLDCVMPIMRYVQHAFENEMNFSIFISGKEACEMIRRVEKNQGNHIKTAKIVAVTANTWEQKEHLLNQGFDEVAYKPIILDSFKQLLVKVLKSQ